MLPKPEKHQFLKSWLQDLSDGLDDGWYNIIPFWLITFLVIGLAVAYLMPDSFWTTRRDNATAVYAAILTMNGIILALTWSAFAKIYENIGAPKFSAFLQKHGALEKFLFFVSYTHVSQMIALSVSAITLIITQFEGISLWWQRSAMVATIGVGVYAIKQAAGSVTVMHDLIRYRAIFDADSTPPNSGTVRMIRPDDDR
jgi:hypothetical protein